MANLKDIRRRITSVKNTKQITRAMKLVSAAKLRRANDAASRGKDYVKLLGKTLGAVSKELPEDFSHPLLEARSEVKNRLVIYISGERGLCGAYNSNLEKFVLTSDVAKDPFQVIAVGRRAVATAKRRAWNVHSAYEGLAEDPSEWPIKEICEIATQQYLSKEVDEVLIYFTEFRSAVAQEVRTNPLLPLTDLGEQGGATSGVTKFSPAPEQIFEEIMPLVIHSSIMQCALESKASEHAARMTAMDAATNNANDLIDKLKLFYNRARQSAITTELIDIVGGAEAQN